MDVLVLESLSYYILLAVFDIDAFLCGGGNFAALQGIDGVLHRVLGMVCPVLSVVY